MKYKWILSFFVAAVFGTAVHAQEFPAQPIHIMVPYTAGGVTDIVARSLAKIVESSLGKAVVIENKPGANGTLGALKMVTARPDGYNLSIVPVGIFRQPVIQKMSFDPIKDLTYISSLVDYTYVMAVRNDSKWKTVKDFAEHARMNPGMTYGTPGIYSTPHLSMEEFSEKGGFKFTHVPYKGAAEIIPALMGGQVDIVAGTGSSALASFVKRGDIRVLAAISDKRLTDFPDVPTLKESGFDVVAKAPFGLVGPAGMDPKIVAQLDAAFKAALNNPEFTKMAELNGVVVQHMGPGEYSAYAKDTAALERLRMGRVIEEAASRNK
ncbi:MAG TPA: tripartite tricarboxylate transporter substrate binding protein [Eoetvoesiella sp.]